MARSFVRSIVTTVAIAAPGRSERRSSRVPTEGASATSAGPAANRSTSSTTRSVAGVFRPWGLMNASTKRRAPVAPRQGLQTATRAVRGAPGDWQPDVAAPPSRFRCWKCSVPSCVAARVPLDRDARCDRATPSPHRRPSPVIPVAPKTAWVWMTPSAYPLRTQTSPLSRVVPDNTV